MVLKFPCVPNDPNEPCWTGNGFQIGSEKISVLKYTECNVGWDATLTNFHETEAEHGNHFIDRASRSYAICELKKRLLNNENIVLEIGSSSGYLLQEIKKALPDIFLLGSDCIPEPLENIARKRSDIPLLQFDLVDCPLPDNCVNIVIALNVLEHIQEDKDALKQIYRILKPGGYAIIEVPANPQLYDFYDEQLKHFRRYDLKALVQLSKNCGFMSVQSTHLGFWVYPGFKYAKCHNKKNKSQYDDAQKQNTIKTEIHLWGHKVNTILYGLMRFELSLGRVISYPCGIRCLVTLRKPMESINP